MMTYIKANTKGELRTAHMMSPLPYIRIGEGSTAAYINCNWMQFAEDLAFALRAGFQPTIGFDICHGVRTACAFLLEGVSLEDCPMGLRQHLPPKVQFPSIYN